MLGTKKNVAFSRLENLFTRWFYDKRHVGDTSVLTCAHFSELLYRRKVIRFTRCCRIVRQAYITSNINNNILCQFCTMHKLASRTSKFWAHNSGLGAFFGPNGFLGPIFFTARNQIFVVFCAFKRMLEYVPFKLKHLESTVLKIYVPSWHFAVKVSIPARYFAINLIHAP